MRFPLDQGALCFALMLEIGVTVLVRLMVWFALVHLCLTLGSLWSWFDSSCVDLTRWFMRGYSLVRVGGLVVVGWLFFLLLGVFGGVIVIHWLTMILNIDWSLWWLVDSLSVRLCLEGGWLVEWWMMIRWLGFDELVFRLLVTCYLVLMFFDSLGDVGLTVGWSGV